jgi:hypothetical protein
MDTDRHRTLGERRRREELERRERAVAAREAEMRGGRPWRSLLWRVRLAPLRIVELIAGAWLMVVSLMAGSTVPAVSTMLCGAVLVAVSIIRLAG